MCLTAQPLGNAGRYSYLYAIGCAMRGRYENGKTVQHIELNKEEHSNSITTVAKDSLVVIIKENHD